MKYLQLLLIPLLLLSCDDNEENMELTGYQVTISAGVDGIDLIENGRANDTISWTDISFTLTDSACNEIESYGQMIYNGELPSVVLPNIPAGKYYYSLTVHGGEGIKFGTASNFTISSDTALETSLANHQMRYRFIETSDFDSSNVEYVRYILNFSSYDHLRYYTCPNSSEWSTENYDGYVDAVGYPPFITDFEYTDPMNIESVQIKFYDYSSTLIKSHIIPLEKRLDVHHSYTFKVDLTSIWNGTDENSITIQLEDVSWTEEEIIL